MLSRLFYTGQRQECNREREGRRERAYDLTSRDEVSRDEWARNKLHAECAKLRGVICLTPRRGRDAWQLFLSASLSLSLILSLLILFFIYPRNCTTNNRSAPLAVIGRHQWRSLTSRAPPSPLLHPTVSHSRDDRWHSDAPKHANWREFACIILIWATIVSARTHSLNAIA